MELVDRERVQEISVETKYSGVPAGGVPAWRRALAGMTVKSDVYYPKVGRKFGKTVTYWDDHTSHIRTEFGLDVLQVAGGKYASNQYHKFIGFEVSKPVLERAFQDTYGMEIKDVFANFTFAVGSYRYGVSSVIPGMVRVAWDLKKDEITKDMPGITRQKFLYNLSRSSYEKEWGKDYHRPGLRTRILAWFIRVLPKVGPLRTLQFRVPTPEVEKMFMASFNATIDAYKVLLESVEADQLKLPNRNLDVGEVTRHGDYEGADETYAKLIAKLSERKLEDIDSGLRSNILAFYSDAKQPEFSKAPGDAQKQKAEWLKLQDELAQLKQLPVGSNALR